MSQREDNIFAEALRRLETRNGATTSDATQGPSIHQHDAHGNASHPHPAYLRALWRWIAWRADEKDSPVYLYGAGAHSRWWLSITEDLPMPRLAGFLDDHPTAMQCCGHPVLRADRAKLDPGSIVVISSDRLEDHLYKCARSLFDQSVEIVRPYEGLPPGPYPKPPSARDIARRVEATRVARDRWGGGEFVGPYERAGYVTGFLQEQWLWANRELIRGRMLDMSTPRYWHRWMYDLPAVTNVSISDLDREIVMKDGYASRVDVRGDFCADPPPVAANSFDAVLCLSILEHCREPATMVRNLRHTLARGGAMLLVVPFVCIDGHCRPDYWRFGRDGLTLLAQQAGFQHVRTGTLGDVGPVLEDVLGLSLAAGDGHDGIPLLTWLIALA